MLKKDTTMPYKVGKKTKKKAGQFVNLKMENES